MSLFKNWVLYREDSNTHEEIYLVGMRFGEPVVTSETGEAAHYETPREAYVYAGEVHALQWWRVGKR